MNQFSPNADRPDPSDRPPALRARVPDHVSRGVFSTGAIVMTGATEFLIDFAQNLGRPFQVVARVILPHPVLPQFVDALARNIELYTQRYGAPPDPIPGAPIQIAPNPTTPPSPAPNVFPVASPLAPPAPAMQAGASGGAANMGIQGAGSAGNAPAGSNVPPAASPGSGNSGDGTNSNDPKRPTAQDIYDELKIRDEVLSGSYANAVMIGHSAHEFNFDFITNFYPQSAVSCRVFVSAGQIVKLHDSLRTTWEQFRQRNQPPMPPGPPLSSDDFPG